MELKHLTIKVNIQRICNTYQKGELNLYGYKDGKDIVLCLTKRDLNIHYWKPDEINTVSDGYNVYKVLSWDIVSEPTHFISLQVERVDDFLAAPLKLGKQMYIHYLEAEYNSPSGIPVWIFEKNGVTYLRSNQPKSIHILDGWNEKMKLAMVDDVLYHIDSYFEEPIYHHLVFIVSKA